MKAEIKKLAKQLQVEVDTAFLYKSLSEVQTAPTVKNILGKLSEIETTHADRMLAKVRALSSDFIAPLPSRKARFELWLTKIFGYDFLMSKLMGVEKQIATAVVRDKLQHGIKPTGFEHTHLKIVEAVSKGSDTKVSGGFLGKIEGRHKSVGGNALRAAVLGANDGLVSNMSLVMGVTGAAAENKTILITGLAGLLAGAISMALGEWLSVQSSRELYKRQIALEAEELESSPEQERIELSLLYQAKGIDAASADALSTKVIENKETALDTLVREELGIDIEELGGSAWEAAITSFFLFAIGAIIPVLPFMLWEGETAIFLSLAMSVVGLFAIGSAITLFTGRSIFFSGFRQVLFGLAAAAVTFGIGKLIGVSIAG